MLPSKMTTVMSVIRKHLSPEHKAKISAALNGRPQSPEHRAKRAASQLRPIRTRKVCPHCKQDKGAAEFGRRNQTSRWLRSRCRECEAAQGRRDYHRDRRKAAAHFRKWALKARYGLTSEAYERLLQAQGGTCAICHRRPKLKRQLDVDHCHATKITRGLLCDACNRALGYFKDDERLLTTAIAYLRRFRPTATTPGDTTTTVTEVEKSA